MFTPNDILSLAKAGFTAQQIGALNTLNNVGKQPVQVAQQPMQPVQVAQQPMQPVQQPMQPVQVAQQPAQNDMFSQIMAQLQTNAINATQQPQQQTTDDILASIINPNE